MRVVCLLLVATAVVVSGQPGLPTELPSTCASVTCLVGTPCREVLSTSGIVSGTCLSTNPPVTGNEGVCTEGGQPLLVRSATGAITEATCGPRGGDCPSSGYSCNQNVGVCCQSNEKSGTCPVPKTDGSVVGICAFTCSSDSDCSGRQKCCTNECGGTVCQDPVSTNPEPPAPTLTCANMLCIQGTQCRALLRANGQVEYECIANAPTSNNNRVCASGLPLLSQSVSGATATEVFCGRGPSRVSCPSGYFCNIAPNDAYAVCCEQTDKAGECPDVAPGEIGTCANTCSTDGDCSGDTKCCRNGCGATVCRTPKPSCATKVCPDNQECQLLDTPCAPGTFPCNPVPTCVDKTTGKSGACPVVAPDEIGTCFSECRSDGECSGDLKCCRNGCGANVCRTPKASNPVKTGECPAVLNNGDTFGVCAFLCNTDNDCRGDEKCCKNECGGTICKDPVPNNPVRTCETTRCAPNQRCEMQQVVCVRAPCYPLPVCVDIERKGVCPAPRFTWDLYWRARCQRDCESDAQCPGVMKCCNDFYQCGTKCENPQPSLTCANTDCRQGFFCQMQDVVCVTQPCFPVPNCIEIARACSPSCRQGYKCELQWNRFTGNQQPTCVMDPDNPPCSPTCSPGFECKLQQPWWCWWNCTPRPTCVRSRNCPMYPAWINPNCVRRDDCSETNPYSCYGNTICCSTDCGRRCVTPLS